MMSRVTLCLAVSPHSTMVSLNNNNIVPVIEPVVGLSRSVLVHHVCKYIDIYMLPDNYVVSI